jgi:DNA-binding XRE family transcriptional regulator
MAAQILTLPNGEEAVAISPTEYQDLVDIRDHVLAMRDMAAGNMPIISDEDMDAYLAAPTALAFWREHRKMTQTQLAQAVEVTQPYINQIENGHRQASVPTLAKLARHLGVRIDDLVMD